MDHVQALPRSNTTLRRLSLYETRIPEVPMPFCALKTLSLHNSQEFSGARCDRERRAIVQLVSVNIATLEGLELAGYPPEIFEPVLARVISFPVRERLYVLFDGRRTERSWQSYDHQTAPRLVVSVPDMSLGALRHLLETVGRRTDLSTFVYDESIANDRLTLVRDTLLPLLRTNKQAPVMIFPHLQWRDGILGECMKEISFYRRLRPRRELVHSTHLPDGLWPAIFANADEDTYPGPSVLYRLVRAKVNLLCNRNRRGVTRDREVGDESHAWGNELNEVTKSICHATKRYVVFHDAMYRRHTLSW